VTRSPLAFRAAQGLDAVVEHMVFRRRAADLGATLAAYRAHHRHRISGADWSLGALHSVVVPCFGHAEFVAEAVASIVAEEHRPLEIVFVDDASLDDTLHILTALAAHRPTDVSMRIIRRRRNGGQAAAINLGVLAARGDAVTVVNDDDVLVRGALPALRSVLAEHRAHLVGADCISFEGATPPCSPADLDEVRNAAVRLAPSDVDTADANAVNVTHTGTTFLRTGWWAVRGYRPWARTRIVRPSDRDFQLRVGALFGMVVIREIPLSLWRWGWSMDSERFT
jgi:glycosyltransferase involved in cell wall biosynthesis